MLRVKIDWRIAPKRRRYPNIEATNPDFGRKISVFFTRALLSAG
jgi:hypothetical protein